MPSGAQLRGEQAIEDLLWVVNSPSFVTGENVAPHLPVERAAIDPVALERFLAEHPAHRVGRYFENLLHFWLRYIRKVELLGVGMQVRDGKRTVGELDFLYQDEIGNIVHCEAAVKFFLHHPRPGASDFPGPNASDDFERKAERLFEHQLEFSRGRFDDVTHRQAFVKGMVFYGHAARPEALPDRMAPDHLVGRWFAEADLHDLETGRYGSVGALCDKPHWLAAPRPDQLVSASDLARELRQHFASDRPHPVMLSMRLDAAANAETRIFAVGEHWPHRP